MKENEFQTEILIDCNTKSSTDTLLTDTLLCRMGITRSHKKMVDDFSKKEKQLRRKVSGSKKKKWLRKKEPSKMIEKVGCVVFGINKRTMLIKFFSIGILHNLI